MPPPNSNEADDGAPVSGTQIDHEPPDGEDADLPPHLAEQLDGPLSPGDEVGEYLVEDKLGEGGFGTVYRAEHPLIGKSAAVKVLSREFSSNPQMVSRFVAEARAANTIRHGNIIDIFNFGTLEDGRHYFVMELLDGQSMEQFLSEQRALDPPLLLQIMDGVARALDAAHDKGIVHRDLKPDNIFLNFDEQGRPIPKLLDFGIAKLLGEARTISSHRTRTGTPIGTPHYMSPEQCMGEAVDERADVYGFGVVCFEALTGQRPFVGDNFLQLMNRQATGERPRASDVKPELGTCFDDPLRQIMAIDQEERPSSVGEALELLETAAVQGGFELEHSRQVPQDQRRRTGGHHSGPGPSPVSAATAEGEQGTVSAGGPLSFSPAPPRRGIWIALGTIVAGVAVYGLTGLTSPDPVPPQGETTSLPSSAATAAASPKVGAVTSPTSEATQPDPVPSRITIHIKTTAKGAKAFVGEIELGDCPGQLAMDDPGNTPVAIVLKAPGYQDETVTGTLEDGQILSIELKPKRAAGTPIDSDLETPTW